MGEEEEEEEEEEGSGNGVEPEDDDGGGSPPRSPFTTEVVNWMRGVDDEILAVLLRGFMVGATRIPVDIAGPFLFRLNELVHAIASVVVGRRPGARGTLPDVPGAGMLALTGVEWGHSAVFHFGLGPGEELRLGSESTTEEAVSILASLVRATASEADEQLLELTKTLGHRVGVNYMNLIQVLDKNNVDSLWRTTTVEEAALNLSISRVRRAKVLLEREEPPTVFDEEVTGLLYRADSKEHQFVLAPIDREEEKIVGTYAPPLREEIRHAWDKVVRVRLRTTHYFLARQIEPYRVEVELLEVIQITDD